MRSTQKPRDFTGKRTIRDMRALQCAHSNFTNTSRLRFIASRNNNNNYNIGDSSIITVGARPRPRRDSAKYAAQYLMTCRKFLFFFFFLFFIFSRFVERYVFSTCRTLHGEQLPTDYERARAKTRQVIYSTFLKYHFSFFFVPHTRFSINVFDLTVKLKLPVVKTNYDLRTRVLRPRHISKIRTFDRLEKIYFNEKLKSIHFRTSNLLIVLESFKTP